MSGISEIMTVYTDNSILTYPEVTADAFTKYVLKYETNSVTQFSTGGWNDGIRMCLVATYTAYDRICDISSSVVWVGFQVSDRMMFIRFTLFAGYGDVGTRYSSNAKTSICINAGRTTFRIGTSQQRIRTLNECGLLFPLTINESCEGCNTLLRESRTAAEFGGLFF